MSTRSRFGDAVEEVFAAEIKFTVNGSGGRTKGVIKVVDGQLCVFAVMAQDDGVAVAGGDIDASGSADGRGKNEIVDAFQANRFAARLAGNRIEARENVLIVSQKIEGVVVKKW